MRIKTVSSIVENQKIVFKTETSRDSLDGPVFKGSTFPQQGAWDLSLVEELGFQML